MVAANPYLRLSYRDPHPMVLSGRVGEAPKWVARRADGSENSARAGPCRTRSRPNRGDTRIVSI